MSEMGRAAVYSGLGKPFEIREFPVPDPEPGAIVVKVSKPQQDMRFDVPVVGLDTLRTMIEVEARVLAVEAGKSILLNREKLLTEANTAGIAVVGFKDNSIL